MICLYMHILFHADLIINIMFKYLYRSREGALLHAQHGHGAFVFVRLKEHEGLLQDNPSDFEPQVCTYRLVKGAKRRP